MMSEPSERPVKITAEERPYPALEKLARACIALALGAIDKTTPAENQSLGQSNSSSVGGDSVSQERSHG
jgi:hypothetical protein